MNDQNEGGSLEASANVLHPGDPGHPGEQVKAAGATGAMTLYGDITLRSFVERPTVTSIEAEITQALANLGYDVHVNLKAGDR